MRLYSAYKFDAARKEGRDKALSSLVANADAEDEEVLPPISFSLPSL